MKPSYSVATRAGPAILSRPWMKKRQMPASFPHPHQQVPVVASGLVYSDMRSRS